MSAEEFQTLRPPQEPVGVTPDGNLNEEEVEATREAAEELERSWASRTGNADPAEGGASSNLQQTLGRPQRRGQPQAPVGLVEILS